MIGACAENNPNRLCLQSAIWDKQFLLSLLFANEDGWIFESMGSTRSQHIHDGIFSVYKIENGISYCAGTAVHKGYWTQGALQYAQSEKLALSISSRGTEWRFEKFLSEVNHPLLFKIVARLGLWGILFVRKHNRRRRLRNQMRRTDIPSL